MSDNRKDVVDSGAIKAQADTAAQAQAKQQLQWQVEQNRLNQANTVTNALSDRDLKQNTMTQNQEAANFQRDAMNQGAAMGATGGPNGIKAAATITPIQAKLQAAGLPATIPGIDSLQNLLKKRTVAQSNVIGNAGAGNSLMNSGAALGGS